MTFKPLITGLFAGALMLGQATTVLAESQNPIVVELFTSQGCSSCPPADELLHKLAQRDDVLPLALHVDYWDYIGWADSFARPEHTLRQKAYAHRAGSRTIYTPQMVIAGEDQIVGARPMEIADAIMNHLKRPQVVSLDVQREQDVLAITVPQPSTAVGTILVHVIRYMPEAVVMIERGENAGRTLTYTNIVTGWSTIGEWSGAEPLSVETQVDGEDAVAVILQHKEQGPIVAAAVAR